MKTVIRNSYTPKIGDYCETIVVDKETENAYIFDCDGIFTEVPQPVDVEKILEEAAAYTDEQVAPLAEKLDTIEEGAQVNVIEHVLRNGTELTITNKTVNVTVPTKTSDLTNDGSDGTDTYVESDTLDDYYTKTETDTQIGYETTAREIADSGLQEQIDAIVASSDVVDIVGTYAALQAYDTSKLHDNDIIKVLEDETRDDATTYYRWDADTSTWGYIGAEGPFYTKAESDATFVPQTRTVNGKALSANISLTASDVGALPDSTVIPTVNDATLTIQKNGTSVATFTANSATNATANITVPTDTSDLTNGAGFITSAALPTKTSELTNDGSDGTDTYAEMGDLPTKTSDLQNDGADGTSTYVEADELATVATTGDYDDLLNKPTIPTVNDATLTIQKNGTDVASFTANSSTSQTANITVPTDTSDLTNGAGFITTSALSNYYTKSETYSQNEVNSLINTLSIPTKTSDLTNDGSDGTSTYVEADALATVATTGDYGDLLNKPTIPSYSDFTGATSGTAGAHGLVPAPAAGDEGKFLQGDGTWATVSTGQTYTAGSGIDIDANNEISVDTTVVATQTDLSGKQDALTAGDAIDITSNVISVEADSALDVSSTKPVQNSVVTAAINGKQDTLTAGSNIQINNNTISATDTTYSNFVGTDGQTAGTAGLVPAPATTDAGEYLKADGTWDTPPGVTYTAGTNVQINGTVISATDTTYSDFTGATSSVAGAHGLVPAPTTSDADKYLKGDGTWATVTAPSVTVTSTPATSYSGASSTDAMSQLGTYRQVHADNDGVQIGGGGVAANVGSVTTAADYSSAHCIAIGGGATVADAFSGHGRIAIGDNALANRANSMAIGAYSYASGGYGTPNSVAIGTCARTSTTADYNTVIGGHAYSAGKYATVIGSGKRTNPTQPNFNGTDTCAAVLADYGVAVGTQAQVLTGCPNSVALGYHSKTSRTSEVAIGDGSSGTAYGLRYLANVKDGVLATDAATVGQLPTAMTGATSSTAGTSGLVPAPSAGDEGKYLKGDGTWGGEVTIRLLADPMSSDSVNITDNMTAALPTSQLYFSALFSDDVKRVVYQYYDMDESDFTSYEYYTIVNKYTDTTSNSGTCTLVDDSGTTIVLSGSLESTTAAKTITVTRPMNSEEVIYNYTQANDSSANVDVDAPVDFTTYKEIRVVAFDISTNNGTWMTFTPLDSSKSPRTTYLHGYEIIGSSISAVSRADTQCGAVSISANGVGGVETIIERGGVNDWTAFQTHGFGEGSVQSVGGLIKASASTTAYVRVRLVSPKVGSRVTVYGKR